MGRRITQAEPEGTKWCARCQKNKPLDEFGYIKYLSGEWVAPAYRRTYCLDCTRQYNREYSKKNQKTQNSFIRKRQSRSKKWQETKNPGVYIIDLGLPDSNIFKLGRSVHAEERLRDLQAANPNATMVEFVPCADPKRLEAVLHGVLKEHHLQRELYMLEPEDVTWLKEKLASMAKDIDKEE